MEHGHTTRRIGDPDARGDVPERLAVIEEQGRQTLELVRSIITLLLPKEGSADGVPLEDLIAGMVAMQRDLLIIARATRAEVKQLGETLPAAVAEAVQDGARPARMS